MSASASGPPGSSGSRRVILEKVRPNWLAAVLVYGVYAALLVLGVLFGLSKWNVQLLSIGPLHFNLGAPIIVILVIIFLLRITKVKTDQVPAAYFLGIPLFQPPNGPIPTPPGVEIEIFPTEMQEVYIPAPENKIFWKDEESDLPAGMQRPVWLPTKDAEQDETGRLARQMFVGVIGYVFWKIVDPFTFKTHMGSIEEANKQLIELWKRVVSQELVKHSLSDALSQQEHINELLDDRMREFSEDRGLIVTDASITRINISHSLGRAMRDLAQAQFERDTSKTQTDGKAYEIEQLGRAEAARIQAAAAAELIGKAKGIEALSQILKDNPAAVEALAAQTAADMVGKANVVMAGAGSGITDIFAAIHAARGSFTRPVPTEGDKKS